MTNRLFALGDTGAKDPANQYVLELNTNRSYYDELYRGIQDDIPLISTTFVLMGVFCAITLAQYHRIRSQSLLGIGAVVTILLSILTSYGLMFCVGRFLHISHANLSLCHCGYRSRRHFHHYGDLCED